MKRRDLLNHLQKYGCHLVGEGGSHSIWGNSANKQRTAVPRHREIPEFTAARICKQLEIPEPSQ